MCRSREWPLSLELCASIVWGVQVCKAGDVSLLYLVLMLTCVWSADTYVWLWTWRVNEASPTSTTSRCRLCTTSSQTAKVSGSWRFRATSSVARYHHDNRLITLTTVITMTTVFTEFTDTVFSISDKWAQQAGPCNGDCPLRDVCFESSYSVLKFTMWPCKPVRINRRVTEGIHPNI